MSRARVLLKAAVVVALLIGAPSTAQARGATSGWTNEPVPPRDATSFLDTAASGDGTAWAFGGWYRGNPTFTSQAYRRGQQGWQEVPVPNIGRLEGSTVVSATDAWAVGNAAVTGNASAVHWDGATWQEKPMAPPPQAQRSHVYAVAAFGGNDVWTAGDVVSDGQGAGSRGDVQHWNGTAWTDVALPAAQGDWALSGVGGSSGSDMWAVGSSEQGASGLALHYDGKQWSQVPVPALGGSPIALNDIASLAPNDVWAVGTSGLSGADKAVAMHWDGAQWRAAVLPTGPGLQHLARAGNSLYAVGSSQGGDPFVLRLANGSWQAVAGPKGGSTDAASALSDGGLLTVGHTPSTQPQAFASVLH